MALAKGNTLVYEAGKSLCVRGGEGMSGFFFSRQLWGGGGVSFPLALT